MSPRPQTIDEYFAPLSVKKRTALETIRRAIKSAAPKAEECISYQTPAFRLGGRVLVWFGFPLDRPVPARLVRKLVKDWIAEHAERTTA